jgi:large subunit ribosomal protein L35
MARKSVTKRIKITGSGKVLRRKMGLSHFRAKKTGKQKRGKRKAVIVHKAESRKINIKMN